MLERRATDSWPKQGLQESTAASVSTPWLKPKASHITQIAEQTPHTVVIPTELEYIISLFDQKDNSWLRTYGSRKTMAYMTCWNCKKQQKQHRTKLAGKTLQSNLWQDVQPVIWYNRTVNNSRLLHQVRANSPVAYISTHTQLLINM